MVGKNLTLFFNPSKMSLMQNQTTDQTITGERRKAIKVKLRRCLAS